MLFTFQNLFSLPVSSPKIQDTLRIFARSIDLDTSILRIAVGQGYTIGIFLSVVSVVTRSKKHCTYYGNSCEE